jgi:hypothetical protein
LINEDDLNVLDDLTCGHATVSTDSLVDVTAILGSPLPANSVFTIAIGRTGEQFIGWTGAGSQMAKLEYQLYVYTEVVPGPGMAGAFGIGGLMVIGRRKRN